MPQECARQPFTDISAAKKKWLRKYSRVGTDGTASRSKRSWSEETPCEKSFTHWSTWSSRPLAHIPRSFFIFARTRPDFCAASDETFLAFGRSSLKCFERNRRAGRRV